MDATNSRKRVAAAARRLEAVATLVAPGGVLALWPDEPPEPEVEQLVRSDFRDAESHMVEFDNVLTGGVSSCTVYPGRGPNHG